MDVELIVEQPAGLLYKQLQAVRKFENTSIGSSADAAAQQPGGVLASR